MPQYTPVLGFCRCREQQRGKIQDDCTRQDFEVATFPEPTQKKKACCDDIGIITLEGDGILAAPVGWVSTPSGTLARDFLAAPWGNVERQVFLAAPWGNVERQDFLAAPWGNVETYEVASPCGSMKRDHVRSPLATRHPRVVKVALICLV